MWEGGYQWLRDPPAKAASSSRNLIALNRDLVSKCWSKGAIHA
jgi:hypothetical protein